MQAGAAVTSRPVNNRAAVTNDPRRLAPDADMRSLAGRRFADIYDQLASELPGADPARLREIALLKFEHEKAQAAGSCSLEDTVRVHNLVARLTRDIRAAKRQAIAAPQPSLAERLALKYPKAAS
jgi:hypothetical protein